MEIESFMYKDLHKDLHKFFQFEVMKDTENTDQVEEIMDCVSGDSESSDDSGGECVAEV